MTDPPLCSRILVVDDDQTSIRILSRILEDGYELLAATSGGEALALLKVSPRPDLILLDVMMPEMDGYTLCAELKRDAGTRDIPVIFITARQDAESEAQAFDGGAVDFIHKPITPEVVRARVRLHLELERRAQAINLANAKLNEWNSNLKARVLQQTTLIRQKLEEARQQSDRIKKSNDAIISLLSDLLDQRYHRLSKHSLTVSALATAMATALNLHQSQVEEIRIAALLHDIGCIGLPDRVLAKSREMLTADELQEYRTHPVRGQMIVGAIEELRAAGHLIRHHHESYDGTGYPDGLAGENIPLGARIIALANWIEATFSREGDADAKYHVTRKLTGEMGRLFDPAFAIVASQALNQILQTPPVIRDTTEEHVALNDLRPGMVLARSIHSLTGILILQRGAPLDADGIALLRRYYGEGNLAERVHVLQKSIPALWVTRKLHKEHL